MSKFENTENLEELEPEVPVQEDTAGSEASEEESGNPDSEPECKETAQEKELNETKEKYLRLCAEYDNYRKRTTKEKIEAFGDATAKTVTEFLLVVDNFERALQVETADESFKSGILMIFNQYKEILKKLGVEEIDALNQAFDPSMHNAINQVEDENFGENTVCQVLQKDYRLGERVIRYAMVTVANP